MPSIETNYCTHSNNMWLTSELKNLHFPSVTPSLPACFNLRMQLSTSAGKHRGRFGSSASDILPSPDCTPFGSEVCSEVSACVPGAFSVVVTLLLPLTIPETPGSVFTLPWLLTCGEFCNFAGEEWLATMPFVPCVPTAGLEVVFEGVVARALFAEEEGDANRFTIFALPKLCFFLCFFSLSFSPLKIGKRTIIN